VAIEFDARAITSEADIKVVVFGDGTNFQSGYTLAHGDNGNSSSYIQRLGDPAIPMRQLQMSAQQFAKANGLSSADPVATGQFKADTFVRLDVPNQRVQVGRSYRWRIERRGGTVRWLIDGQPYGEFQDPFPLTGAEHDRFGFSSDESAVAYDNFWIGPVSETRSPPPKAHADAPPALPPGPFADNFDREDLGNDWLVTAGGTARIDDGALVIRGARNRPVWLKKPIPENATIEMDAWTNDPQGDIKFEAWGDGQSFYMGDPNGAYTATGYVFIFGGWKNTATVLAKQEEHAPGRPERRDVLVTPGKHHHLKVTRKGGTISWFIDGTEIIRVNDPEPLTGPMNQYFGFSGWETEVHFDNLKISGG
jgi:hypothetical protein